MLEPLVLMATTEQLRVIEEIVGSKDEYIVYSNLASQYASAGGDTAGKQAKGIHPGRGLGWVMALARVELGAMIAGFTDRPEPFTVLPPTRYELPQFAEILFDSAKTHYLALRNDPVAQFYWSKRNDQVTLQDWVHVKDGVNEQQAIAYARRCALAREFAVAVGDLSRYDPASYGLSPQQESELKYATDELDKLQVTIVRKVLAIGAYAEQSASRTQQFDGLWAACSRVKSIAREELQSGTANVRSLGRTQTQSIRQN